MPVICYQAKKQGNVYPEFAAVQDYENHEPKFAQHIRNAFEWCRDGRIDKAGREEMLLHNPVRYTVAGYVLN